MYILACNFPMRNAGFIVLCLKPLVELIRVLQQTKTTAGKHEIVKMLEMLFHKTNIICNIF